MEFRRLDSHSLQDNVFPLSSSSSSSLNYAYFSHASFAYGSWRGRNVEPVVTRAAVQNDAVGFPSSYVPVYRFEWPEMLLHGDRFSPDVIVAMPVRERYDGAGRYYREIGGFEAVSFRRSPPFHILEEVNGYQASDIGKEIVVMEEPTGAIVSGIKRKAPIESPPAVAASSGFSSRKVIEEWRCAVCEIRVTCERGLTEHLAGKKHQAKVESLEGHNTNKILIPEIKTISVDSSKGKKARGDIGLGINTSPLKKQRPDTKCARKSGKGKKKFKFWCKICKIGAYDETVMNDHKKGKKHLKNKKASAQKRFSGRKNT